MFLQACVCPRGGVSASVHAGIPCPREQTPPQEQTPPSSRHPPGADTPQEQTPSPGEETATAVDSTHPTGMHSCYVIGLGTVLIEVFRNYRSWHYWHFRIVLNICENELELITSDINFNSVSS